MQQEHLHLTQTWLSQGLKNSFPQPSADIVQREAFGVLKETSALAKAIAASAIIGVGMGRIITSTTGAIQDADNVSLSSLQQQRQARAARRQIVTMTRVCRSSSLAHLLGVQP